MNYSDITTRDANPLKRWIQRRRFADALAVLESVPGRSARLQVLDYGAGNGELVRRIAGDRPVDAWVFEPSPHLMAEARENLSGTPSVTFADTVEGLPAAAFDVVYCLEVLEHLPDEQVRVVLGQLQRLLRPGGTAIIGVPHELFLPALVKGAFRALRRYGDFDTRPRHILAAALGRPPATRPLSEIAPGLPYHFHHLGFDFRALERTLRLGFDVRRKWFSPVPLLDLVLNSEVYFLLTTRPP